MVELLGRCNVFRTDKVYCNEFIGVWMGKRMNEIMVGWLDCRRWI